MSFGGSTSQETIPKFKSFVSEAEIEEKRKKRQEEWDKVRSAEDPVEAPEEEYDPRSLFERLEEQRLKKQADYEEAHKLSEWIGSRTKAQVALRYICFQKERMTPAASTCFVYWVHGCLLLWCLDGSHKAVASLSEEAIEAKRLEMKKAAATSTVAHGSSMTGKRSQSSLLSAAVKRKSADSSNDLPKKQCTNSLGETLSPRNGTSGQEVGARADPGACGDAARVTEQQTVIHAPTALRCLGVLPGLGVYTDSSDSENSSYSDDAELDLDLIGRRRLRVQHDADHSPKPN
ncbi:unnamed protein product [Ixodes hexagonus]